MAGNCESFVGVIQMIDSSNELRKLITIIVGERQDVIDCLKARQNKPKLYGRTRRPTKKNETNQQGRKLGNRVGRKRLLCGETMPSDSAQNS